MLCRVTQCCLVAACCAKQRLTNAKKKIVVHRASVLMTIKRDHVAFSLKADDASTCDRQLQVTRPLSSQQSPGSSVAVLFVGKPCHQKVGHLWPLCRLRTFHAHRQMHIRLCIQRRECMMPCGMDCGVCVTKRLPLHFIQFSIVLKTGMRRKETGK